MPKHNTRGLLCYYFLCLERRVGNSRARVRFVSVTPPDSPWSFSRSSKRMAVNTQQGLRLLTTHGALVRVHLYPGVLRVTSIGDSRIILSDPSHPNGGNLKIGPHGQRADWKGGRGPWARFEVASTGGSDGAVQLRSVGHFEVGRRVPRP
eukprot:scaffold80208_cov71-Phaeocystis_antarctica.AAC.3